MLKFLPSLSLILMTLLTACPTPTIDPIDPEVIEKLKDSLDSGITITPSSDAGHSTTQTTDAGTEINPIADAGQETPQTTDAGTPTTQITDAGTETMPTTDAGTDMPQTTDAGTDIPQTTDAGMTCEPCVTGFAFETGTCNCVPTSCSTNNGGCDTNATCTENTNPNGARICTCQFGFEGNGINCEAQCEQEGSTCSVELYNSLHGYGNACSGYGALFCDAYAQDSCPEGQHCVAIEQSGGASENRCAYLCGPKTFTSIGVATDFVCGTSVTNAGISCVGNIGAERYDGMLEKYDDISCHGNTCCAVSVQQNLTCFSSEETLPNWASETEISNFRDDLDTPATMIAALTIGDNHGCIQHNFRADCWGEADYCNVAMSCSAYPNCNYSEVPCDGFMEPMQQELVQIKTSRTNTCGLVYNTFETNSPNYVKCTGQVGWGLGGVEFLRQEDKDEFPFYSTADISGGYFFDGTNHTISGIHAIALDEKRLCLTGSFEVESMTLSDHVVCAGRVGFGEDKDFTSTMLYGGYNRFEVSGTWGCGELQESDGIFLGGGMGEDQNGEGGPIVCHDLDDLDNMLMGVPLFDSAHYPVKEMVLSGNSICIIDGKDSVMCEPLPGMNPQNFHSQQLGQ